MRAAIIYLTSAGKVLLLKRCPTAETAPDMWGLPGGHIEPEETPAQAAVRELREETGLTLTGLADPVANVGDIVVFRADVPSFTPVLNDEHTGYEWVDPAVLPSPLHPGLADLVAMFSASARRPDFNGWPEIPDNPISRVGVFQYSGRAINLPDADPNRMYGVFRPEEELNNPETIESFKLLPFTNDHPTDMMGLDEDLPKVDGKPADGVIGERVYFDTTEQMLRGNLKLFTERINRAIDAGKREVSAGFRCIYVKAAGIYNGVPYEYIQRKIRGNHASLVTEGRAGSLVAVLDHLNISFDAKEAIEMADPVDKATDGEDGQGEMTLAEITTLLKSIGPQVAALTEGLAALSNPPKAEEEEVVLDADGEGEGAEPTAAVADKSVAAAMDAMEKRIMKAVTKLVQPKGKALDSKDVIRTLEQRDALYQGVSKQVGAFAHNGMDAQDIAAYAVDKLGLQNVPTGAEIVAVESYLSAVAKQPAAKAMDSVASTGTSAIAKHVQGGV